MTEQPPRDNLNACVEHGIWTALPIPPPIALDKFTLKLAAVDPTEDARIKQTAVMTFHMAGCTGDDQNHQPQQIVADAMTAQTLHPGSVGLRNGAAATASFLFHLGDVVYKDDSDDQAKMYNAQFYAPYTGYHRSIFAIPGNHDGKFSKDEAKSAIDHFIMNFCAASRRISADNRTDNRPAMTQPYPYWRLSTPLAYFIGLYSNIANGGILDDPPPSSKAQYNWLVAQLKDIQCRNKMHTPKKAVFLVVHYPPYSGAANFKQRGDPRLGPSPSVADACPLADVLQQAFVESGQRPDAVFSAHAHLYQRLTYRYADGWEVPYLIAGSGGHTPVESMWALCSGGGAMAPAIAPPFAANLPAGLTLPANEAVEVAAYNDQSFGFLRLTVASSKLTGEFFAADARSLTLVDAFVLDMNAHRLTV